MRYAVISDVHANLPALEACVEYVEALGVTRYVCAGDLVGYGPQPNECVRVVRDLRAICVRGNHDEMAVNYDELAGGQATETPMLETSLWTRNKLEPDVHAFLIGLPRTAEVGPVIVAHGSLDRTNEYIQTEEQAQEQLRLLGSRWPGASILVLGHTHRASAYSAWSGSRWGGRRRVALNPRRRYVINPGSVGQSRQWEPGPRARFAVLDDELRAVTFYAIKYDHARTREALRAQGLASDSLFSAGSAAGALRRLRGRLRGVVHGPTP